MGQAIAGHELVELADGLYRLDTRYYRPGHTSAYILGSDGAHAVIDSGVGANVPALLTALSHLGATDDTVHWILPTHVHLDHAGGVGGLFASLPKARVGVHPSGVEHLVDPTRLEAGVRMLYGDAFFDQEYAPLTPVPADRVSGLDDEARVTLGTRALRVLNTPGHAWHHLSIYDEATDTLLAGDAFGAGYPGFGGPGAPFMVPVVPPPQFKPEAYRATLARILALSPAQVAPAHFPLITDVRGTAERLGQMLEAGLEQTAEAASVADLEARLLECWARWLPTDASVWAYRQAYGLDIWLTAEGMWLWRCKQEKKAAG